MSYGTWDEIPNISSPTQRPKGATTYDSRLNAWKDSNGNIVPGVKSYDETQEFWDQYTATQKRKIKEASDGPAVLGTSSIFQHFRGITPQELGTGKFSPPVSILDIETGHNYEPISVSVLQGVVDKRTGEFRVTGSLERYYTPKKIFSTSFNMSREVHRLTKGKIAKLRELQQATYSESFDSTERDILKSMLKNTLVVGHNVEEFDFSKLGMSEVLQDYKTLDTLIAAENMGVRRGKRGLDPMFSMLTGRTMKQAGYTHHVGFHDVLANAEVYSKLYMMEDTTGRDIRYVTNYPGVSYGKYEEFAGTGIIKGGYWSGRGAYGVERYMDRDELAKLGIGTEYDDDGNVSLSDNLNVRSYLDEYGEEEYGGSAVDLLYLKESLKETFSGLTEKLQAVKEEMGAYNLTHYGRLDTQLSRMPPETARRYLAKKAIPAKAASGILNRADILRASRQQEQMVEASDYVWHMYNTGAITQAQRDEILDYADPSVFSPRNIKYMTREYAKENSDWEKQQEAFNRMRSAESDRDLQQFVARLNEQSRMEEAARFGNMRSDARDLSDIPEDFDRDEATRKLQYLHKVERSGKLSTDQITSLQNLSGSYDGLVDATDDLIKKNQQLLQVYDAIGKVKMYDPNQYLASARNQATGIFGATRGVVPSFLLNPASRLTDAMFNYQQGKLAGFNAISRTWNSGIGSAVTGALGATMGSMGFGVGAAITGGVNAISQIAGNVGQYRLEKAGFAIQNTLNTLGAAAAWVTTPLQLLGKAAKTLLGGLTGLSGSLSHLMKGGLTEMGSMGNPLSDLTGVNYSTYQGTTMMDVASLFNKGSMNSTYEDFARQQRAFYTTGEVNTSRLISASLLGIYSDVYGPDTQVDTKTKYNNMVNGLLQRMEGQSEDQRAQTLYLASQIDSNLPGLLRTARMLNVTDINTLMDPSERDMYWRPIDSVRKNKKGLTEEQQFRWDQYEFGAARTQFSVTKMRFADKLWNAVGKDLYNGFNRLSDSALKGDWTSAIAEATNLWDRFKVKFVGVWNDIKKTTTGEGGGKGFDWAAKFTQVFTEIGIAALEIVRTINNAWGQLVGIIADKASGLISYLSTVSIKPHWDGGKLSWEIQTVKDTIHNVDTSKGIAKSHSWTQDPQKGWQFNWAARGSYEELARQLFPTYTDPQLSSLTVEDLRKKLMDMRDTWTDPEGNAGKFLTLNGSRWVPDSEQSIDYLLRLAGLEPGREFEGGVFAARSEGFRLRDPHYGTQYGDALRRATAQMNEEIINPIIDAAQDELRKTTQRLEMNIKVNDKSTAAVIMENGKAAVDKVGSMLSSVLLGNNMSVQVANQR